MASSPRFFGSARVSRDGRSPVSFLVARLAVSLFFSNSKLQRLDLGGGPAVPLADAPTGRGGTWNSNGMIIFAPAPASGLRRIAATGGPVTTVTSLDAAQGENSHRWPLFLPDGRRFIYLIRSDKPHVSGIYLGSLDKPLEKTQLTENWIAGAYSRAHGNHPDLCGRSFAS